MNDCFLNSRKCLILCTLSLSSFSRVRQFDWIMLCRLSCDLNTYGSHCDCSKCFAVAVNCDRNLDSGMVQSERDFVVGSGLTNQVLLLIHRCMFGRQNWNYQHRIRRCRLDSAEEILRTEYQLEREKKMKLHEKNDSKVNENVTKIDYYFPFFGKQFRLFIFVPFFAFHWMNEKG